MASIAFIGLGNMGGPMALNLLRAGHTLHVFDLSASAVQTLVDAGATGGLPAERIRTLLASDEGLAEVHAQLAQARSMGISAVPTFVIDGRYAVQGGQAPEVFAQALRQAMADAAPAATSPGEAACGPDGCAV